MDDADRAKADFEYSADLAAFPDFLDLVFPFAQGAGSWDTCVSEFFRAGETTSATLFDGELLVPSLGTTALDRTTKREAAGGGIGLEVGFKVTAASIGRDLVTLPFSTSAYERILRGTCVDVAAGPDGSDCVTGSGALFCFSNADDVTDTSTEDSAVALGCFLRRPLLAVRATAGLFSNPGSAEAGQDLSLDSFSRVILFNFEHTG